MTGDYREVPCAGCGVRIGGRHGEQQACPACGLEQLVIEAARPQFYGVRPIHDAEGARDVFARLYAADREPESGPPPTTARLLYVPFYRLSGTMIGVAGGERLVHRWAEASIAAIEDRDDLGLEHVEAARALDEPRVDPGRLAPSGEALVPDRDRDEVAAFLAEQVRIPADGSEPVLVDQRLELIAYPIWRLAYEVDGAAYRATIDALSGTVLSARLPARQRRRVFLGVVTSAIGGYILGTMLRHPGLGLGRIGRAIAEANPLKLLPMLGLCLVGAFLYALLINAAWNGLRYRNELVYLAGLKTRVLINRPSETFLDQVTAAVKAGWDRLFGRRRYDR